jgi:peptide/nickel transport system substrate-binding protein
MRGRVLLKTIALVGVLLIVGAACSKKKTSTGATPSASAVPKGGNLVVGAEQWPDSANPVVSALTWYWYTIGENIFPYAMQIDEKGNFQKSILTEAPTLDNGGITQSPFTVTEKIDPKAVWEDGSPITSEDVKFTWRAQLDTTGSYVTSGYDKITDVDTTDPHTAVLKFESVYVDWPDLFGGVYLAIFKKAAFPNITGDKVDLAKEMQDGVPFSGGPWILKSWSKDQAVLVPNPKSFPRAVPNFDQVTMVPREDLTTQINSVLTGEVAAVYPQPPAASVQDQVAGNPNVKVVGADGAYYDALWLNLAKPPTDDPKVREALSYAVDRQATIDTIIKKNSPGSEVLNCGAFAVPTIGPWCTTKPFEDIKFDTQKAIATLTADGYDCSKVPASPCTKDGKPLSVTYVVNAPNTRRTTTQELQKEKLKAAGFAVDIKNAPDSATYFGMTLPHGNFNMADYASGGSNDPSNTSSFSCNAIPTKANNYGGGNWSHWCNKAADTAMMQADQELDPQKRLDLLTQVYQLQRQDFVFIPQYVLPNLGIWRTDQIAGPIDKFIPSNLGMFFNMNEWYRAGA